MRLKPFLALGILIVLLSGCSLHNEIDVNNEDVSDLVDGTYSVASRYYDSYGYKKDLSIGVHQGIITEVSFSETDRAGALRASTPVSWPSSKLSYNQIIQDLYDQTITNQGEDIDVISGATKTSDDFSVMLKTLRVAAEKGGPDNQVLDLFTDTFTVTNEVDPLTGSQEEMTVVIVKGQISSVTVREVNNTASLYPVARAYASLAEISTQNHSLNDLTQTSNEISPQLLERYNALLGAIRSMMY